MTKQYEVRQRTRYKNATHSYKHPGIQQNKITTKTDLNKCVFRISGAIESNIPGMEPICPNSKMLQLKLVNICFNKGGFGICGAGRNTNPGDEAVQNQHI